MFLVARVRKNDLVFSAKGHACSTRYPNTVQSHADELAARWSKIGTATSTDRGPLGKESCCSMFGGGASDMTVNKKFARFLC